MTNATKSCPEGQAGQIIRMCLATDWAEELINTCCKDWVGL